MRFVLWLLVCSCSISALQIEISPSSFVAKDQMLRVNVQNILKFLLVNGFYGVLLRMLAFKSVDLRSVYEASFGPSDYGKLE